MKFRNFFYYAISFFTGAATLVIELVALRLLAPYFGTSSFVTGITINTVLLALALGYYLGGYAGDRFFNNKLPFFLLLFTSIYLFIFYIFYNNVLQVVSGFNVIAGTIISIISIFFIPLTILAFIPTYFIRILTSKENVGSTAGKIYAVSTLGSIIGGIATTFVLIPFLGSKMIFLSGIISIFILGAAGLALTSRRYLIIGVLLFLVFIIKPKERDGFIYSKESEYNIIKVGKDADDIYVYLNNYDAFFSKSLNDKMLSENYYDYFLLGPMINDAKDILILGNGAGTSMIGLSYFFNVNIEGVEIDKELTKVGNIFFHLKQNDKMKIIHEDARVFINRTKKKYDIIIVDLYNGGAYIPFHLATVEFFQKINQMLSDNGIMITNIPLYALNNRLEEYYINSIRKNFNKNYLIDHVLFSFKKDITRDALLGKVGRFKSNGVLTNLIKDTECSILEYTKSITSAIFTDEKSKIDMLTYSALKR